MIKLKCEQCGGVIQITEEKVDVVQPRMVKVKKRIMFECEHCGTQYMQHDEIALHDSAPSLKMSAVVYGSGAIAQGRNSVAAGSGGVAIGGSVKGAIIVTGDKQVVIAEVDDDETIDP